MPDVRELIRAQDQAEKPAALIVDGVGIGRGIVQELGREMRHLLPGNSFDDQNVSSLKVRRFHNSMPAMYDGLVRLPVTMPGLEILLNEFAAFPDGRHDDQVDAVCNVAAHREHVIRHARLWGERLGRLRPRRGLRPRRRRSRATNSSTSAAVTLVAIDGRNAAQGRGATRGSATRVGATRVGATRVGATRRRRTGAPEGAAPRRGGATIKGHFGAARRAPVPEFQTAPAPTLICRFRAGSGCALPQRAAA